MLYSKAVCTKACLALFELFLALIEVAVAVLQLLYPYTWSGMLLGLLKCAGICQVLVMLPS